MFVLKTNSVSCQYQSQPIAFDVFINGSGRGLDKFNENQLMVTLRLSFDNDQYYVVEKIVILLATLFFTDNKKIPLIISDTSYGIYYVADS